MSVFDDGEVTFVLARTAANHCSSPALGPLLQCFSFATPLSLFLCPQYSSIISDYVPNTVAAMTMSRLSHQKVVDQGGVGGGGGGGAEGHLL